MFGELVKLVKDHLTPPLLCMMLLYNFNTHSPNDKECIADFVASLPSLRIQYITRLYVEGPSCQSPDASPGGAKAYVGSRAELAREYM